ncbi:hypothetical protein yc1106_09938 [Curvularia clavata]|uniref:Nucleoside phosphorylase domain-containing protein n=1 Tax=Curvularia clavata TaxID=95742 RepID=A0A9Q8ZH90_CURCL|nr:hypothetical protein yc1106_09938 [Curvularia clavata]
MSIERIAYGDFGVSSQNTKRPDLNSSAASTEDSLLFSQQRRSLDDYTVGWICAITAEYVAAQAFLDARHDTPEMTPRNDNNSYTLGKIGHHDVVIAALPIGEYGAASAARVATDMLRTFPNVRIGLMVGTAGGAPNSKHDIRLGDVVVSVPHGGKGGVFPYDFGKIIQGKDFKVSGHMDKPPITLRNAVMSLQTSYQLNGHQLDDAINEVLEQKPRLKREYKRPDPNTDSLYLSKVTHPGGDELRCTEVCGDNPLELVPRKPRTQDDDNPTIHYGRVASGNKLVKDAFFRDKMAKENGILCFEMEAAGLMNHFPCLVIRGISNYADTHKNDEWQGYASMTAAAYAKDLLYRIPANDLRAERSVSDIVSAVERNINKTRRDMIDSLLEQRQAESYLWVPAPDPSTSYNNAL